MRSACFVMLGWASGAFAADAFLSRSERRELVDVTTLSSTARDALATGMVSATEPRLGVPTFFWVGQPRAGSRTPRDMGLSAEQVARRLLFTHAELYRAQPARWAEARLAQHHSLNDGGAVILAFHQDVAGVRVFRDEVKVALTKDFVPVAIAGYLTPELRRLGDFRLSLSTAAAAAVARLSGAGVERSSLVPLTFRDGYQLFRFADEPTPVRARPVWFPVPEGLEPGYYVEVELSDGATDSKYFSFVISAADGRSLYENNLTAEADFRVWAEPTGLGLPFDGPQGNEPTPHPTGTPSGAQPPFVPQQLVSREYGPISTMDPWLPTNATRTEGNNTFSYVDVGRPNGFSTGDLAPSPTSQADAGVLAFDRLYDVTRNPDADAEQRMAAATQLFYNINFLHDWYYDVGFDERSGNAQRSNLGRGGIENDPLNAEAQDYSGRSNANMSTPSDGARPRMQMYIFTAPSTERITYNGMNVTSNGASFGPQQYNVTGQLVLVNDGDPSGMNGSVTDGCQANFASPVAGKIALVDRGNCTFVQKAQIAEMNGALGVIIVDTQMSNRPPDLIGSAMPNTTIPAMSITRAAGVTLRTAAASTLNVTLFRTAATDRDGTLDNAIVAHEWGHYISNRLIGDGNGLSSPQARGMGEGWSDFHALLMMVRESDLTVPSNANWMGAYAIGGYTSSATSPQGHYYGVRRVPYSVDPAKNGLTFKHVQAGEPLPRVPTLYGADGSLNAQSHSTGEVWASMLWEAYVELLRDRRLTFEQARERMMRYLVGGYKLTPVMPTFIEARDAILAAAIARDPQDFAALWTAFARRGLGMQAQAPERDAADNRPAVESFAVGDAVAITDVSVDDSAMSCDNDGVLDVDEIGTINITVKNVGVGPLSTVTVGVASSSPGLSFPQSATGTAALMQPFASATVRIPVTLRGVRGFQGVTFDITANAPTLAVPGPVRRAFQTRLNRDVRPNGTATDDVEAPMSRWTVANDPNGTTGSDWRIAQNSPTSHWWYGPNPSAPADTYLISPPLSVGAGPLGVQFKHRYEFEEDGTTFFDGAVLELSADGRTWTDIGAGGMPGYSGTLPAQTSNPLRGRRGYVGKSMGYPSFITEMIDLGTQYAGQTVRVRFRIGADDASALKGWEVDDIAFTGLATLPFTNVAPDPNTCSGNRAPTLNPVMNLTVREGDEVTLSGTGVDPDGDMVTLNFLQRGGPMVSLSSGQFIAPSVDQNTELLFDVVATDGALESMPQRLTVTVLDGTNAPTVMVPMSLEVKELEPASVTATAVNPLSGPLTFSWRQVSGPSIELRDANADTVRFTAPGVREDTTLVLEVIATSGQLSSAPAQVQVLVREAGMPALTGELGKVPAGCGCTSGVDGLGLLAALGLLGLRRRRE